MPQNTGFRAPAKEVFSVFRTQVANRTHVMFRIALIVLASAVLLGMHTPTQAWAQQKTKAQQKAEKNLKKQWKAKAKAYSKDPLSLKNYEEGNKERIADLEAELRKLKEQLAQQEAEIERQANEIRRYDAENQELKAAYQALKQAKEDNTPRGLIFKVQIGAFEKFNINQYLNETENFEGESADGLNKYTIGNFRDPNLADAFRLDIRKMGIKDAWLVPYRDGIRITMTEAKDILKAAGVTFEPAN